MSKVDCAAECFINGFNCAQAVFSTYCGQFGLDEISAKKIACGFGGGMSYIGETCGAVTGAIMLIGLKHGKSSKDDNEAKESTYRLVQEFAEKFKAINGSVKCAGLLAYDLSKPEELAAAREAKIFGSVCVKLVKDAARILEEMGVVNT